MEKKVKKDLIDKPFGYYTKHSSYISIYDEEMCVEHVIIDVVATNTLQQNIRGNVSAPGH